MSLPEHVNADIFDLFVFWDAACATEKRYCRDVMQRTLVHRVFGFVNAGWSAECDSARKILIESLVGPILSASVCEAGSTQRGLVLLPYRCKVKVAEDADTLERKRRLVWKNNARNQVIADFAAELMADARSTSPKAAEVREHLGNESARCLVLVESPEQAQSLARKLRDWDVVTYEADAIDEVRETGGLLGSPILHSKKVIMTTSAANAIYGGDVQCYHNVAVWAGGGQQASRCTVLGSIRVVVDVGDGGGRTLGAEARRRIRSYQ